MTTHLYIDTETFSHVDLKRAGVHPYAQHPSTEVTLFGFAIGGQPAQVLDRTTGLHLPPELKEAIADPAIHVIAHNSQFDRLVLRHAAGIDIPLHRWRCSMAKALSAGLPGTLATLGAVMGLTEDQAKLADGRRLVLKFCKPMPANRRVRRHTRITDPEDWQRFIEYCRRDVEALRTLWNKLPDWNYPGRELELWRLDQSINERGICIDTELTAAAIRACDRAQASLAKQTVKRTRGEVSAASQRDKMLAHLLSAHGVELSNLRADTVEKALADTELPHGARALLEVRQQASKSSTAKYKTLASATSADGRLRGTLQYCGASRTGRWSGRKFQPQNLPSRGLPPAADIALGIEAMKADAEDLIFADVMAIAAGAVRGTVVAPKSKKLVVSDLANIEGRMAAWLAGEDWKCEAFRQFDAGEGPDLYNVTAGQILSLAPEEVSKDQRQGYGKVPELACSYGGGASAFQAMAEIYDVDMAANWPNIQATLSSEIILQAKQAYHHRGARTDIPEPAWTASEAVKLAWRERNPAITSYWYELERSAVRAIRCPSKTFTCRRLRFRSEGAWLLVRLPCGRLLCYAQPRIDDEGKLTYMGMNQYSRRWERPTTYGAKLLENVTQAASRDVLADGMIRAEAAGYAIVLTVHDELVCEVPDTDGYSAAGLSALIATVPDWAEGLPLAASGFECTRYRKE